MEQEGADLCPSQMDPCSVQSEKRRCCDPSTQGPVSQLREAVRAPLFRANSIMDEEQAVRIVFSFDFSEARVAAPPVRMLPSVLEKIALTDIRSRVRHERTKLS